jgi:hypothetical protein
MSLSHLATIGTLKYNGYTFDGASSVKCNVEFVKDDAGRTVIYSRHTIEVTGFVADSSSTDGQLENIRERLSHQGQELIFTNKGFGDDLVVNSPGSLLRDVKWGPAPEMLYWEPVGSSAACEFSWKVTTCVPVCDNGNGRTRGVMAFNFAADFSIDQRGLTTRNITGYLEIAITRDAKNVPDSADSYRYLIQPDLPAGFQRHQDFNLSADKSRLDFSFTDTQLPTRNPWPNFCTKIDARHRNSWAPGTGDVSTQFGGISADIELAASASPVLAWAIFGGLVRSRFAYAIQKGLTPFLDELHAEEEIFGLGSTFDCSFRLLRDVGNLLAGQSMDQANNNPQIPPGWYDVTSTGMWQPVGTDWRLWRSSLSDVFYSRGLAGLAQPANTDVIVDLCGAGITIPWTGTQPPAAPRTSTGPLTVRNQRPDPRRSFLSYKMRAAVRRERYLARQKPMQSPPTDGVGGGGNQLGTDGVRFNDGSSSSPVTPDTIQQSSSPSYEVLYVGSATRAGYEIPRPAVTTIGGQTAVESEGKWATEQLGVYFGVPVFQAVWAIKYLLAGPPSGISGPPNITS